jgi:hypothetical protein
MITTQITVNVVNDGSGPKVTGSLVTSVDVDPAELDDQRYCLIYLKLEDPIDEHTVPLTVIDVLDSSVPVDFEAIELAVRKAGREAREAQNQ